MFPALYRCDSCILIVTSHVTRWVVSVVAMQAFSSRSGLHRCNPPVQRSYRYVHSSTAECAPRRALNTGLLCHAAADASIVQDTAKSDTERQQDLEGSGLIDQQQQMQQLQQQEGLLGPLAPGEGGIHLEVDRVVERELLESNGEAGTISDTIW